MIDESQKDPNYGGAGDLPDGKYDPTFPFPSSLGELYDDYILTANNFYCPKTYEYNNTAMTHLTFYFRNCHGVKLPIFYVFNYGYTDENNHVVQYNEGSFLWFKIECELITL
jgi:hypothetical protein